MFRKLCLWVTIAVLSSVLLFNNSALASLNDDRYDGNMFVVYAGNGSLVPPRFSLEQSLERKMPTFLVYYLDDSSDCKQFANIVSNLQNPYGRVANFIPVSVDSLPVKDKYEPTELGYYYQGVVPQAVILDQEGKVVFNGQGQVKYEELDDVFREVFDLLPRDQSIELKLKSFNEFNSELTN
jgi:hypothetical protein